MEPFEKNYITDQPVLEWGNSRNIQNGELCYIMGDPLGIDVNSISSGIVRDNKYVDSDGITVIESILTDAPAYSGNSGSPIVDSNNKVIGMYTWNTDGTNSVGCLGGGVSQYILEPVVETIIQYERNFVKSSIGISWSSPHKALKELSAGNNNYYIGTNNIKDAEGLYVYSSSNNTDFYKYISKDIPPELTSYDINDNVYACVLLKTIKVVKMNNQLSTVNNPIKENTLINLGVMDNHFAPTSITWFLNPGDEIELQYKIVSYYNKNTQSGWLPSNNEIIHTKSIKVHEFDNSSDKPLNKIS